MIFSGALIFRRYRRWAAACSALLIAAMLAALPIQTAPSFAFSGGAGFGAVTDDAKALPAKAAWVPAVAAPEREPAPPPTGDDLPAVSLPPRVASFDPTSAAADPARPVAVAPKPHPTGPPIR